MRLFLVELPESLFLFDIPLDELLLPWLLASLPLLDP